MTFEELQHANSSIETKTIRGKDYAEVNQRVKAFRIVFPEGAIKTKLLADTGDRCVFQAIVTDQEGRVLGTGTAYEEKNSSNVNRTSYIENCETSAVGRALGFVGFGIDTSIASAEEVEYAIEQQSIQNQQGPQPVPDVWQEAPAPVPEAPRGTQQPAPAEQQPVPEPQTQKTWRDKTVSILKARNVNVKDLGAVKEFLPKSCGSIPIGKGTTEEQWQFIYETLTT